jgi:serine/threonine-protein kinase
MPKKIFKLAIYFFSFLILGGIAGFLIFKIINFEKRAEVPLITGKSVTEALEILKERGLLLEIEGEEYDEKIAKNHIIAQGIEQGERIEKRASIEVIVSKGKALFKIPYLEGLNINDVQMTLKNMDLAIGKITKVHSYTVDKNIIIAQRPLPGYSDENRVNILVSLGLYDVMYRCPVFVDMTVNEARKVAAEIGLRLLEKGRGSVVVFQKPEAGAVVKKGDIVEITLGRGWGLWF